MAPPVAPRRWLRALIPAVLILAWLAVFAAGGSSFSQVNAVAQNDREQHLPASAEATTVHEWESRFRESESIPALVVFERTDGITDADRGAIEQKREELAAVEGFDTERMSPAIGSGDGEAVQLVVPISSDVKPADAVTELRSVVNADLPAGLTVAVTGPAGLSADIVGAFAGLDGLLLIVALAVVLVILVIVYRSPLLPVIMLGTSLVALTGAIFTVVALAKAGVVVLTGQTQGILMILVVGAATDYSLLFVARFREALRDHERPWDAAWAALRGAAPAILASGGTVIAGLLCLLVSELNSNQALGPVAAIGIVFALLASLTLLPALMVWAGRAAFWPRRPDLGSAHPTVAGPNARGIWPWVARLVSRRPRVVWLASAAVLAVATVGLVGLKADGVSQSEFVIGHSEARDGQQALSAHFPAGSGTPALIVVPQSDLAAVARTALGTQGVASLTAVASASPSGTVPVTANGVQPARGANGPLAVDPTVVDGRVMLQATLEAAGDSPAAETTVRALRAALAEAGYGGGVLVGGVTAVAIDTNDAAIRDRTLILPIVLLVILLILTLLLRAVLAPLLLIATVVLSFGAALGVSSLLFNTVFGFPGADPSVPMFGFVFLVALGIDYNIFLMTRVREEALRHGAREGVLRGLVTTGGVITSAGVVLAATFAALGVLPVLFLAQISFIVAFGVLVDTVIVRSLLVPALAYDIGRAIWWPGRLAHENPAGSLADRRPHVGRHENEPVGR